MFVHQRVLANSMVLLRDTTARAVAVLLQCRVLVDVSCNTVLVSDSLDVGRQQGQFSLRHNVLLIARCASFTAVCKNYKQLRKTSARTADQSYLSTYVIKQST
jgi:hypothetical protein